MKSKKKPQKKPLAPKAIARRWFEHVWNRKNPVVLTELMDPSAVGITEGGPIRGPDEFRTHVFEPLSKAFPDFRVSIDGMVSEGNDVMLRWSFKATHGGPFGPVPASGRRVACSGMTWLKCRKGKIVGGSDSYNLHGLIAYLSSGAECATVRSTK